VAGRPVVNVTFAFNYALNRAWDVAPRYETVSYHLVNVTLHVLIALLLFAVLRRTIATVGLPDSWRLTPEQVTSVVTIAWLVHPIQTDTVDYLTQRTELIVSAFYLATLYASIRAYDASATTKRRLWYAAAVACCALGMESKEVMATAPIAVMLYDAAFHAKGDGGWRSLFLRRRWFYASLWVTLVPLVVTMESGARSGAGFHGRMTWSQYFVTQGWAIWRYLGLVVWPVGLTLDYGQRPVVGLLAGLGLLALMLLGVGAVVIWRKHRWLGFTGIWFFLLIAPSSSIIPIQTEIAAERRVYLALVAPIVVLVIGGIALWERIAPAAAQRLRGRRVSFAVITCVLVAACAWRSRTYVDPARIWADAIHNAPSNARAYDNLAAVIVQRDAGGADSARALLRQAIAVDSTYIPAWLNLAILENQTHDRRAARALLEQAVRIDPNDVAAARDLGLFLSDLGEAQPAIPYLERVARVTTDANTFHALGSSYAAAGRISDAATALARGIALDPTRVEAVDFLGAILVESAQPEQALGYLDAARRRGLATPMTLALSSVANAQLGRADTAVARAAEANRIGAKDPRVYQLLGRAMLSVQRVDAAGEFFTMAIQLDASNAEAFTGLAIVAAARGNVDEARRFFRQALAVDSLYQPARIGLSRLR